jgi:hypothetical protein
MRPLGTIPAAVLLSAGLALAAHAQYAAKITINTGNSFVVNKLNIMNDRLFSDSGQASTSVSSIQRIEFRFTGISLDMCESMFRSGDRKSLESLLKQYVGPVLQYNHLPTNLGDYLVWMLRVQFWNGNYSAAGRTVGVLRKMDGPRLVDAANLYFSAMLLEQGKADDAATVFTSVMQPDDVSVPMAEYIRGRLAAERGDYRQAMQHVSTILAFHSRDPEWMPPATALEARVYLETGQAGKAAVVAEELIMAYPGSLWSERGEEIKKEINR